MKIACNSIALFLLTTGTIYGQIDRQKATTEYTEMLAEQLANQPPVDPAIALEGMTSGHHPDIPHEYVIVEGDIQIKESDLDAYLEGPTRAVIGGVASYWGSTVPYDFSVNVSAANQTAAINAMNAIAARANITFRPLTGSDLDWIRFNASNGNNSAVGRQGGTQFINISSWGTQFIIVHEIYHALGFWHQQGASDRDTYVTINNGNICGASATPGDPCNAGVCQLCQDNNNNWISCASQFSITGGALYGPYDFDSFMHYGRNAFSCNGSDTITVNSTWNAQWQNAIGQRTHFSLIDGLTVRGIYPYSFDRWVRAGGGGSNLGTFFNPFIFTFINAYINSPTGSTMFVDPGTYSGIGTYNRAMTIRGTYGTATIGN